MLEMLLSAFILGVVVTMPPGAVTLAAGKRAITQGFNPAFSFTAGSLLVDGFYVMLVYLGLAPLLAEYDLLRFLLWTVGGGVLAWLGWDAIQTRMTDEQLSGSVQQEPHSRSFISGAGLTFFNPMVIVSWVALAGGFFANWQAHWPPQTQFGLLAITSIMVGVFAWMMVLLVTLSRIRHWIPPQVLRAASILAGIILILMALGSWQAALMMLV